MSLITTYFGDEQQKPIKEQQPRLSTIAHPPFRVQKKPASKLAGRRPTAPTAKKDKRPLRTDVILAMQEPYMQQIVDGLKTYEFRRYLIQRSVERVWFYRTAPHSVLDYVCEIRPARTRTASDAPLEEEGLGNEEFNSRHEDWEGYDYAYGIRSVYRLKEPISLRDLKEVYGIKGAPRGLVYTPATLLAQVDWRAQEKLR